MRSTVALTPSNFKVLGTPKAITPPFIFILPSCMIKLNGLLNNINKYIYIMKIGVGAMA